MSVHFHVDSTWRDRSQFSNPAEFSIPIEITNSWRTMTRTVQAVRPHCQDPVTNLTQSVKLLNLTLPYTDALIAKPFVYVSFQSNTMYKDMRLINTLENGLDNTNQTSLKDAIFVAYCDKIQTDATTGNWIQYKSSMTQTFRLNTKDSLSFRVFDNTSTTIPFTLEDDPDVAVDPLNQVNALFEVTPYVREDRYDNHLTTLYNRI